MQNAAVPPVRKSVRVAASPARAFDLFTAGMHQWWPRAHTLNPKAERAAVIAEPRPGGRWFERAVDGAECNWGRVLIWEPPLRVVFAVLYGPAVPVAVTPGTARRDGDEPDVTTHQTLLRHAVTRRGPPAEYALAC